MIDTDPGPVTPMVMEVDPPAEPMVTVIDEPAEPMVTVFDGPAEAMVPAIDVPAKPERGRAIVTEACPVCGTDVVPSLMDLPTYPGARRCNGCGLIYLKPNREGTSHLTPLPDVFWKSFVAEALVDMDRPVEVLNVSADWENEECVPAQDVQSTLSPEDVLDCADSSGCAPEPRFQVCVADLQLERVPNPVLLLDAIRKVLRRKGRLLLRVANAQCLLGILSGPRWAGIRLGGQRFLYRPSHVLHLLDMHGFRVLSSKSGTLAAGDPEWEREWPARWLDWAGHGVTELLNWGTTIQIQAVKE